jgi:hypothetical protein
MRKQDAPSAWSWSGARADDVDTAEAVGVVESVDGSSFTVVLHGPIRIPGGFAGGAMTYWLSGSAAGELTDVEPLTVGHVNKPMLQTLDEDDALVMNYRGLVIPDPLANSGTSGWSGLGISGSSGYSGDSTSGWSGSSGTYGWSGTSGTSGWSGSSGASGWSGSSGTSGWSGSSGTSGYSGDSTSGWSGSSGTSGYSGSSGASGWSGSSGTSGYSGSSGESGWSGTSGEQGESGFSGTGSGTVDDIPLTWSWLGL